MQVAGNVENSRVLQYYNLLQLKIWLVVIFRSVILIMFDSMYHSYIVAPCSHEQNSNVTKNI
jgi:hypothetical protein